MVFQKRPLIMRKDEVDNAILDEYLQKAKSLFQSKAFQEAEEYYEKAMRRCNELLRLNPENPYLHSMKAYLIYEFEGFHSSSEERRKDALREIDRAIELDPETNYYHFERGDIVAELVIPEWSLDANAIVEEEMGMRLSLFSLSHYVKGFAVDASGAHLEFLGMEFDGVEYEYEYDQRECLERDPKNPDCYNNLGALFHERGTRHMDASLVKRALEMLNRAIALNPNNPAYYNNRALALYSLIKLKFKLNEAVDPEKTLQEALKDLERAVELEPRNPYYHYNLGLILYEAGKCGEAIEELDKAIALDSSNPYPYYKKGMVLYKLGRYSKSLEQFRKALELDKDDQVANYMVKLIEKIENENKRKITPLSRADIERIIMEKEDELLSPPSDLRLEEIPSRMISIAKQFSLISPDVSQEDLKKLEKELLSEILSKEKVNSLMLDLCFYCPAYWFDAEMIYGPEDYVELVSKLSGITRGLLPLSNIECQEVKPPGKEEPEKYVLSFVAFGEKYIVELPYEGDWAQCGPMVRVLNDIMKKMGREERYIKLNTGDQTAYLIFCIPEYYEACRRIIALLYRAGLKCQRSSIGTRIS